MSLTGGAEEVERFAGGKKVGRLRVGAISANGALGNKASIPSRFETVLNSGVREKNAFGRRTYRFDDPENDLPGPGTYKKKRTLLKPVQNFSKKGSAAFAGAQKAGFSEDAAPIITPGPGCYDTSVSPNKSKGGSSAFAEPVPQKLLKVARPNTTAPGPGSYVIEKTRNVPCAAMSQKGIRDTSILGNNKANPGPGEYISMSGGSGFSVHNPQRVSTFNGSKSDRFGRHVAGDEAPRNIAPPLLRVMPEAPVGKFPKLVGEVVKPEAKDQLHEPVVKGPRKSPMFADTLQDRFGNPTVRFTSDDSDAVGPGTYHKDQVNRRMLISSSWALSAVSRDEKKDKYLPPGPAYYNPKETKKSSHHVVSGEYWS